jgi:thienamycin biosynthesis protein ThnN
MSDSYSNDLNERVRRIVALHFDPKGGSPYWIERAAALDFDPRREIVEFSALSRLGRFDLSVLATRPIEDFVPRCLFEKTKSSFLLAETGGTTGMPNSTLHRIDEFEDAFVTPFVKAANRVQLPRGLNWLFVGPSGPHIIGRAAQACARAMDSLEPFTLDFDPRWARKLPDGSFARQRYMEHILSQAERILRVQDIQILFATPPVLAALARHIDEKRRERIRGIHFGGMAVTHALRAQLKSEFPNAVMIAGYGNTLFGVAPELAYDSAMGVSYFAHGTRLVYQIVTADGMDPVPYGSRGNIVAHRLDEAQFLPNVAERDTAIRVPAIKSAAVDGFFTDGLCEPQPLIDASTPTASGLY